MCAVQKPSSTWTFYLHGNILFGTMKKDADFIFLQGKQNTVVLKNEKKH